MSAFFENTFTPVLFSFSGKICLAIACLEFAKTSTIDLSTKILSFNPSVDPNSNGADSTEPDDLPELDLVESTLSFFSVVS